ncbi:hypothetical protein RHA1_ro10442 (plasmid) [Rhodococcus jostii RHA1]|uniref:Uncharacterized protein n=1 Tax=Rhodococcus jostii (strain RHA1) TaxID=101510 RepID=Q0RVQ5_RHOJR|nr:hypothetical protein RHA1_ro10442 [Rhodococcus jostii RHA1]
MAVSWTTERVAAVAASNLALPADTALFGGAAEQSGRTTGSAPTASEHSELAEQIAEPFQQFAQPFQQFRDMPERYHGPNAIEQQMDSLCPCRLIIYFTI